jgi:hypothetical protein
MGGCATGGRMDTLARRKASTCGGTTCASCANTPPRPCATCRGYDPHCIIHPSCTMHHASCASYIPHAPCIMYHAHRTSLMHHASCIMRIVHPSSPCIMHRTSYTPHMRGPPPPQMTCCETCPNVAHVECINTRRVAKGFGTIADPIPAACDFHCCERSPATGVVCEPAGYAPDGKCANRSHHPNRRKMSDAKVANRYGRISGLRSLTRPFRDARRFPSTRL